MLKLSMLAMPMMRKLIVSLDDREQIMEDVVTNSKIEEVVFDCLSGLIDICKDSFNPDEPLSSYGLDSMDGLQLVYDIGERLDIKTKVELDNIKNVSFNYLVFNISKIMA